MNNEDLQKLKALALAATPGPWEHDEILTPWRIDGGEVVGGDGSGLVVVFTGYDWHIKVGEESDTGSSIFESTGEPATIVEGARKTDGAFIAAANPAVILAMIERIESLAAPAVANAANSDALPPLPAPAVSTDMHYEGRGHSAFTADQMQAYARAAIAHAAPNAQLVALVHKAQGILAKHLPPDSPNAKDTISALLWLLDGPESRAALASLPPQKEAL